VCVIECDQVQRKPSSPTITRPKDVRICKKERRNFTVRQTILISKAIQNQTRIFNVGIIIGIIIVEIEINRGSVTSISFKERGGYLDFGAIFKKN